MSVEIGFLKSARQMTRPELVTTLRVLETVTVAVMTFRGAKVDDQVRLALIRDIEQELRLRPGEAPDQVTWQDGTISTW